MTSDQERGPIDTSFGTRLRAARKRAGLSLGELATQIGGIVTRQSLSKYEKGRMMPSPEVLGLLEKALDIRPVETTLLLEQPASEESMHFLVGLGNVNHIKDEIRFQDSDDPEPVARSVSLSKGVLSGLIKRIGGTGTKSVEDEPTLLSVAEPEFASLAERRARYARAWESGGGPERIRFREGEKLPAKSVSALRHRLADYLERYLGLESLLGMTLEFRNPATATLAVTAPDVEATASAVRSRWELGAGPIVNLLGVLEERGIRVFETEGIEGFEGLSGTFGAVPFVAVSRDFPADRIRFTAAHELGHVFGLFPDREGAEGMCHRFAGAFLLPKAVVEKTFGGPEPRHGRKITMAALAEIKTAYGISLQAIMCRAKDLGLVTERRFRAFRETVRDRGWAVTEPVEYAGVERAGRFRRLVHYAVAADILDLERAAQVAGVPPAELRAEMGEVF